MIPGAQEDEMIPSLFMLTEIHPTCFQRARITLFLFGEAECPGGCRNGGFCNERRVCECPDGFYGPHCEKGEEPRDPATLACFLMKCMPQRSPICIFNIVLKLYFWSHYEEWWNLKKPQKELLESISSRSGFLLNPICGVEGRELWHHVYILCGQPPPLTPPCPFTILHTMLWHNLMRF